MAMHFQSVSERNPRMRGRSEEISARPGREVCAGGFTGRAGYSSFRARNLLSSGDVNTGKWINDGVRSHGWSFGDVGEQAWDSDGVSARQTSGFHVVGFWQHLC